MDQDQQGRPGGLKYNAILVGLLGVIAGAIMVATYHLVTTFCICHRRPSSLNTRENIVQNNRQETIRRSSDRSRNTTTTSSTNPRLIPTFRYNKDCNEEMCAVCLGEFKEGEQIRVLPDCLHFFHVACIDTWLNLHSNCPLCRADTSSAAAGRQVALSMYLPEYSNRSSAVPTLELNRLPDFGV